MSQIFQTYGQNIPQSCTLICSGWSTEMIEELKKTKFQALAEDPNSIQSRCEHTDFRCHGLEQHRQRINPPRHGFVGKSSMPLLPVISHQPELINLV